MASYRVTPPELISRSSVTPQLVVTRPAYSESITVGQQITLVFTTTVSETIWVYLTRDNGANWERVSALGVEAKADITVYLGMASLPASNLCRLKLVGQSSGLEAQSGTFRILPYVEPVLQPSIAACEPTHVLPGESFTIYGSSFGGDPPGGTVTLGDHELTVTWWNHGDIDVTVPETVPLGTYTLTVAPVGTTYTDTIQFIVGTDEPPPPEPVPGTTMNVLVALINERLGNVVRWGRREFIADGKTRHFYIPDKWVRELPVGDPDRFSISLYDADANPVGTEYEWGEFDYVNNWYHFTGTPSVGSQITMEYSYQWWPESLLQQLVNASLSYLFPEFYVTKVRDYPVSGSEYVVDNGGVPAAGIIDVQYGNDDVGWSQLKPVRNYRVLRGDQQECLLQTLLPSIDGTLRVRAAFRPRTFALATDTIENLGLPAGIVECIVLYVCWQALLQFLPPRMRFDQATVTQGAGGPTVRDQQSTPQLYKVLLDMTVANTKMRPWVARGI